MDYVPPCATSPKSFRKCLTALMPLAALSAASCNSSTTLTQASLQTLTDTLTVCVTEHDTIIVTESDSATFWAWVRCDSLGQVLIEELTAERGRHTSITPRLVTNGRQTLIKTVATSAPENVIVRRREVGQYVSRSSQNTTEKQTDRQPLRRTLRESLSVVVVFLVGVLTGYLFKALKP